nr:hypothetical protein [Tanacetum cinerariifolium]
MAVVWKKGYGGEDDDDEVGVTAVMVLEMMMMVTSGLDRAGVEGGGGGRLVGWPETRQSDAGKMKDEEVGLGFMKK